jgi:hypothetical protein
VAISYPRVTFSPLPTPTFAALFTTNAIFNMRSLPLFVFICLFNTAYSQNKPTVQRKGFIFGTAAGISAIRLSATGSPTETQAGLSFPNFKIGTMLSQRTAVLLYLPGTIYEYKGVTRTRDRGFEGIVPSVQFWPKDRWLVLGGAGLTLDAPAFYDIKNEEERKFYFGPSVLAGTGFEVWHKGKFALDVQARVHYGTAKVPEGTRKGLAFNVMLGLNWY